MAQVSVIIPVHNAQDTIERCLKSLQGQTFRDWEALCSDDGSTDRSADIIRNLAGTDNRIKLFTKPNGGVSSARNLTLKHVGGRYMMYLDSDDFIHPQTMEICVGLAEENGSDLVSFTYDRRYRSLETVRQILGIRVEHRFSPITSVESKTVGDIFDYASEYSRPLGIDPKWAVKHCQPWRGLFKTEKIAGIRFVEGIIYEDFPWWSEVLLRLGKVTITNLPLYCYYPNFKGYIHTTDQQRRIESLKVALQKADELYSTGVDESRKARWELQFRKPFADKLASKIRKYGKHSQNNK